jgi:hypothetical protein
MITELISNINDEHLYLESFQKFISGDQTIKEDDRIPKLRTNTKTENAVDNKDLRFLSILKKDQQFIVDEKVKHNFRGYLRDRITFREKMIKKLLENYEGNEKLYEDILENFINMEEGFLFA